MELINIQSEKDIKTLLLEEMELAETERVLIILSKNRFDEFRKREDVRENFYSNVDRVSSGNDINYSIYENKNIVTCRHYITFAFSIISGLYIVKDFSTMKSPAYEAEVSKIHFIE